MFIYYIFRFQVAIKTPQMTDPHGIDLLLDEAKTMLEVGTYHDHIVNLQGITYSWSSYEQQFSEVRKSI